MKRLWGLWRDLILGSKRRNRVLDIEQLCWRGGTRRVEEVRRNLEISLADWIARNELKREAIWMESVAVGSRAFLEPIEPEEVSRRKIEGSRLRKRFGRCKSGRRRMGVKRSPENGP